MRNGLASIEGWAFGRDVSPRDDFAHHFLQDVLAGMQQTQRAIPARWFYDHAGSELFEQITTIPEYPVARLETHILKHSADEIARGVGLGRVVVELGSGSSVKTPLLLEAISPRAYVPVDISGEFLRASVAVLEDAFPDLPIYAVEADFMRPVKLPANVPNAPVVVFFPGSTIGNLVHSTAVNLLRSLASSFGADAKLLIGIDRVVDVQSMLTAYDDPAGVTAAFNLNLLHRINRELHGTIPIDAFAHRSVWNERESRIEMHLEARRDVTFDISGRSMRMSAGETIHTENSYKYDGRCARQLLSASGWTVSQEWTDPDNRFGVLLGEVTPERTAP